MICPACRSRSTMTTADDMGLCFDCRHVWDPTALAAIPVPPLEPFAMATVDEVFGPPPGVEPAPAPFTLDSLVGQLATLEGGQVVLVAAIVDDDHIGAVTASGDEIVVAFDDVESIRPIPETYEVQSEPQGDQQAGGTK